MGIGDGMGGGEDGQSKNISPVAAPSNSKITSQLTLVAGGASNSQTSLVIVMSTSCPGKGGVGPHNSHVGPAMSQFS